LKQSALIFSARALSGFSGYAVLAVAANHLTSAQFAALAFLQTAIFLSLIIFDSGVTQLATRETAGAESARQKIAEYQSIRITIHAGLSVLLLLTQLPPLGDSSNIWLVLLASIALSSNAFVIDWVLYSCQQHRLWAIKTVISAATNVCITSGLLLIFSRPEAVLSGIVFSNISGWLYLRNRHSLWPIRLSLPNMRQTKVAFELSVGTILFHSAYSAPLLIATSTPTDKPGAAFAVLYRIFSALTLFVPTVLEFAVAREIAKRNGGVNRDPIRICLGFFVVSFAVCVPIVLIPSRYIFLGLSPALDLDKFNVEESDILFLKLALFLFCLNYASQRAAFVSDFRKTIIVSSFLGLLVGGCVLASTVQYAASSGSTYWFYPLFAYQMTSVGLIILSMTHSRYARLRR
jgi:O-antigen/teichoic acid export membrane protein